VWPILRHIASVDPFHTRVGCERGLEWDNLFYPTDRRHAASIGSTTHMADAWMAHANEQAGQPTRASGAVKDELK
jgi:hypothetical protein